MKKIDIIRLHSADRLAVILNYFARGDYCKYTMLSQKCLRRKKNNETHCDSNPYDDYTLRYKDTRKFGRMYLYKKNNEFTDSNCSECIKKWLLEKYNYDLILLS